MEANKKVGLYDRDYRYNEMAQKLNEFTTGALKEMFQNMANLGYSPRELSGIMQRAIQDIECDCILELYNLNGRNITEA